MRTAEDKAAMQDDMRQRLAIKIERLEAKRHERQLRYWRRRYRVQRRLQQFEKDLAWAIRPSRYRPSSTV
jgi:hypothetical protein